MILSTKLAVKQRHIHLPLHICTKMYGNKCLIVLMDCNEIYNFPINKIHFLAIIAQICFVVHKSLPLYSQVSEI